MKRNSRRNGRLGSRLGFTLVETVIGAAIAAMALISILASSLYYQRMTIKNERMTRMTTMVENMMERIHNLSWYEMVGNGDGVGVFIPSANWPATTAALDRDEAEDLEVNILAEDIADEQYLAAEDEGVRSFNSLSNNYAGMNGKLEVFYTPFTILHEVQTSNELLTANFPIHYFKIELVVTLEPESRIRAGSGTDVWTAVTYVSELRGRTEEEFNQYARDELRSRVVFE